MSDTTLPDEVLEFGVKLVLPKCDWPRWKQHRELGIWLRGKPWWLFGRVVEAMREREFRAEVEHRLDGLHFVDFMWREFIIHKSGSDLHENPAAAALLAAHAALGTEEGA